jgi:two-component system, sensor histidine kinase and response regulator
MPPLILVVEDDPDVLGLMVTILTQEGYRVATAEDGEAGLSEARRARPDLIVLDLMLPRMNALQFRAEQRRDAALRDVPVICLSGASHASTVALELGTDDCLSKPINFEVLLAVVRRHCAPSDD